MTYNKLLGRVKTFLDNNPGKSKYQIAKELETDPRNVDNVLGILKQLEIVKEDKLQVGERTFTNYTVKDKEEKKMKTKQTTILADFLDAIASEKDGFRLGEIWRHTDKSLGGVMPILKDNADKDDRNYVMMEELKDEDVIKMTDSGSIDKIRVKTKSDKPVFVRMGTAFKGETQTRAADTSVIIMPVAKEQEISVKCVYASKGIRVGANFAYAGSTPHMVEKAFVSGMGQGQVWNRVSSYSARSMQYATSRGASLMSLGPSDDLIGGMEKVKEFKKKSKDILKHIPCLENQVGCIIFDQKGILSLEVFDHPKSWIAFHQSIYEKYEDILAEEQENALFELKKDAMPNLILAFVSDLKNAEMEELKADAQGKFEYRTFGLRKTALGEITALNGKIIHILGLRKDNGDDVPERREMPHIRLGDFGVRETPRGNFSERRYPPNRVMYASF